MRLHTSGPWFGLPEHYYRCLSIDPPWRFETFTEDPGDRAPDYPTMTIEQIMALPVSDLAWCDSWVFLWTSGPFLDLARQAMKAWGFRYSTIAFTWVKLRRAAPPHPWSVADFHRGLGKTTRKNTELCLLGKIGSPPINQGAADELIIAPRREHSRKPDESFAGIEALCAGPRIELFARQRRPGWSVWGNQLDRFAT